ncbi:MAG: hypothetical protein [Olavius algarvensis Delta 4 endosymbiont]|nr:MAG: hypothetical protein [Olavius algarvensis Delta 4 endosymbiont]
MVLLFRYNSISYFESFIKYPILFNFKAERVFQPPAYR